MIISFFVSLSAMLVKPVCRSLRVHLLRPLLSADAKTNPWVFPGSTFVTCTSVRLAGHDCVLRFWDSSDLMASMKVFLTA